MSYSLTKKQLMDKLEKNQILGPGYYKHDKSPTQNKLQQFSKNQRFRYKFENVPGPADYDQLQILLENQYGSQQNIGNFQFTSQTQRFQETSLQKVGPGSYINQKNWGSNKFDKKLKNLMYNSKVSYQNSIQQSIRDPFELSNSKESFISNIQPNKSQNNSKMNKGLDWSLQKSSRLPQQSTETTDDDVGPGYYDQSSPNKSNQQKWVFQSKQKRLFDQNPGQYREDFKLKKIKQISINQKKINPRILDDIEDEYLKESNPGPGYYHNEKKSPKKQFNSKFGVNAKRFDTLVNKEVLGPCLYDLQYQDHIENQKKFEKKSAFYQDQQKRFKVFIPPDVPAPGFYDKKFKKNQKDDKNFNSTLERNLSPRIIQNLNLNDIGPGQYLNPDIISFQQFKSCIMNQENASYISQTERIIFPEKENYESNQPPSFNQNVKKIQSIQKGRKPQFNKEQINEELENQFKDRKKFQDHVFKSQPNEIKNNVSKIERNIFKPSPNYQEYHIPKAWVKPTHNLLYKDF